MHLLNCFVMDGEPRKIFCWFWNLEKIGKRSENVRATRPHISVVGYKTREYTKLFHVLGRLHCKNSFDFLWIWFDTTRSEPMFGFLNGPLTYARVDNKPLFFKSSEDFVDKFYVRIKILT